MKKNILNSSWKNEISKGLINKGNEIDAIIPALIAGEHVLMLGPPGTAKSLLARNIAKTINGSYFEWLMTKFTTPDEIFGVVSIKSLQEDKLKRILDKKLPRAEIAFLDEIFKSSSAILNTLLTCINERKFEGEDIPLLSVFAASNEAPSSDLEALYDRFLVKFHITYLPSNYFRDLLLSKEEEIKEVICIDKMKKLKQHLLSIPVSEEIINSLFLIKRKTEEKGIFCSDRKWKQCLNLIRANSIYNGSTKVEKNHLLILRHTLWKTIEEIPIIEEVLYKEIFQAEFSFSSIEDEVSSVYNKIMEATGGGEEISKAAEAVSNLGEIKKKIKKLLEKDLPKENKEKLIGIAEGIQDKIALLTEKYLNITI